MGNKYPMVRSGQLENIVAELNACLGGQYLELRYIPAKRWYELKLSRLGQKDNAYSLCANGPISYGEMYHYLTGLLVGLRVAK